MKKRKVLVDTSIWIEYFKEQLPVVKIIEKELMRDNIFIAGPIISELLQGVKKEKEFNKLVNCIDSVPYFECEITEWKEAGKISFNLRRKGITIPLTDVLLAAIAINKEAQIWTRDKHFQKIPETSLYRED